MEINPGIPIPSARPRASLERPVNWSKDGEDEEVAVCTVDGIKVTIAGTDARVAAEPKVVVDIAEDDPD